MTGGDTQGGRRAQRVDVAIIGGGISGLSAAFELTRAPSAPSFVLLESSHRFGGQVETERVGDCLLEAGPDTILVAKPAGVRLCERLGIAGELIEVPAGRHRISILHRGRLQPLPDGFALMAPTRWTPVLRSPLFSVAGKARMGLERFVPPRLASDEDDESLTSFVTRRFGRELLERIVEPIVAGLLIADADHLSVRAALPRFLEMERRHGSVMRAAATQGAPLGQGAYLRGGMGRLVDALVAALPAERLWTSARAGVIERRAPRERFRVVLSDGREVHARALVVSCPAYAASGQLVETAPELARELGRLRYAGCATVNLGYSVNALRRRPNSSGFFVPRAEQSALLACSFVSAKFEHRAPPDRVLLRAFLGGAARPSESLSGDDSELAERAHTALARAVGIDRSPLVVRVHRYPEAMPQFDVGHLGWLQRVKRESERQPGLCLAGGCIGAVGIPDCIRSGEQAAVAALEHLTATELARTRWRRDRPLAAGE